jgi:hypothetical protein
MVWMRYTDRISSVPNRVYASVSDASGAETESSFYSILGGVLGSGREAGCMAWSFENFPRRQRTLHFRFYEYDLVHVRRTHLGEMTISNPAHHLPPALGAPFPPMTATNGALECSLLGLRCGDAPPRAPVTSKYAITPWITAEFLFRENGQPTTAWTVKGIEAFGATGNYLSVPGLGQNARLIGEWKGEHRVVHFANALWPAEPDWKLIVEVARARDVEPDDTWRVRLPVSSFRGGSFLTNLQGEAVGIRQANLRVTPVPSPSPELPSAATHRISLLLNYTPGEPGLHVDLARATDDQGRELRVFNPNSPWHGRLLADLELATNAISLELPFAIHRSRKFEFKVKPVFVSTNVPSTFPASAK